MLPTLMDAMSELWQDDGAVSLDVSPFGTSEKDGLAGFPICTTNA